MTCEKIYALLAIVAKVGPSILSAILNKIMPVVGILAHCEFSWTQWRSVIQFISNFNKS